MILSQNISSSVIQKTKVRSRDGEESDTTKQKRITQLSLKTTPISTTSSTVLDKTPANCAKKSSRESPPWATQMS